MTPEIDEVRHAPYAPRERRAHGAQGDTLTRDGAARLAATVNAYWAKRGHDAGAYLEECHYQHGGTYYAVRSYLVNARP